MRTVLFLAVLAAGCGKDAPEATEPAGPSAETLQARGAAAAARDEWDRFAADNKLSGGDHAAAAWARAEAAEDDDAARAAYDDARKQYKAAVEAARKTLAEAAEKLYLDAVDARSQARALRQRIDDIRRTAGETAGRALGENEERVWQLVIDHLDRQVFPGRDKVRIDADLERADAFFQDKRYDQAKDAYDRLVADLRQRAEQCETAEPLMRATNARDEALAIREGVHAWLRKEGVTDSKSFDAGMDALDLAKKSLDAKRWDEAIERYDLARVAFERAVAVAAADRAAHEEAMKRRKSALAARERWQAYAATQGIQMTEKAQTAENRWQEAEKALKDGRSSRAALLYRRVRTAFRDAVTAHGRDAINELKSKRKGDPPLPAGRFGSKLATQSVRLGLLWLADHQDVNKDGKWDSDDFMKHDKSNDRCDGSGKALYDVGVSGLALLAFLRAGHLDRGDDEMAYYAYHVKRGLQYLLDSQAEDGVYGTRATHYFLYNHCIATLAMIEAYVRTKDQRYGKSAQAAIRFIDDAQNRTSKGRMGWGYEPRGGKNDTSLTAWAYKALHAGKQAGLTADYDAATKGALAWVYKMTDPNFGQVGYSHPGGAPARPEGMADRYPPEKSQSITAAAVYVRMLTGERPIYSEMIKKGLQLCLEVPPVWNPDDGSIDMYFWYYGTLATTKYGGAYWSKWGRVVVPTLIENQHPRGSGARTGSWDPIGVWGSEGGRVYSTALAVLTLQATVKEKG